MPTILQTVVAAVSLSLFAVVAVAVAVVDMLYPMDEHVELESANVDLEVVIVALLNKKIIG